MQDNKTVPEANSDVHAVPVLDLEVHGNSGTSSQTANSHTEAHVVQKKSKRKKKRRGNDLSKYQLESGSQRDSDVTGINKLRKENSSSEVFENDRITNKKNQELPMVNSLTAAEPSNLSGCSYYMDSMKKNDFVPEIDMLSNEVENRNSGSLNNAVLAESNGRFNMMNVESEFELQVVQKLVPEMRVLKKKSLMKPPALSSENKLEREVQEGSVPLMVAQKCLKGTVSVSSANGVNVHSSQLKSAQESLFPTACGRAHESGSSTLQDAANANRRKKRKAKMKMVLNLENENEKTVEAERNSAEQNVEESSTHCKKTKALSLSETKDIARIPRPSSTLQDGMDANRTKKRKAKMDITETLESKYEKTKEELGISAEQNVEESPTHCRKSLSAIGEVAECSCSHSLETVDGQGELSDMCASPGRVPITNIGRKLLVLDLNGLLVDIVSFVPGGYRADTRISKKALFKRPFCDDFLTFCFEKFNIGVWSSRYKTNVDKVVDFLMGDMKSKLLFCWDQSHCTCTGFSTVEDSHKPLVLKELKKLWDKHDPNLPWEIGEYNRSNTLLLDDSPYKALRNPPNTAVFPPSYNFQDANDNALGPDGNLRAFLEGLAMAEDVQKYIKQNPFGQRAISSRNPSWAYYLKVIGVDRSCEPTSEELTSDENVGLLGVDATDG